MQTEILSCQDLQVDTGRMECGRPDAGGTHLPGIFTFNLLMRHAGYVINQTLLEKVWGYDFYGDEENC